MEHHIPGGPAGLSADWLTGTLRAARAIERAAVTRVDWEVIGADRGFTGVVARLRLEYDIHELAAPASLIAKFPLAARETDSTYRAMQTENSEQARRYAERCEREVRFYQKIAPDAMLAPRAYYAEADIDAGRMLLLLADLSDGEEGDALHACSVEQARLVVEAIAYFHARWWQHPDLSQIDVLPHWADAVSERSRRYPTQVAPCLERHGTRLPDDIQGMIRGLSDSFNTLFAVSDLPPQTIAHTDLHLDNVIFGGAGYAADEKAWILDWQGVAIRPGAIDLALFITGALDVAERRAVEGDLLRRYHDILAAAGVTGYDEGQLLHDYRLALLWQLAGVVGWLARTEIADLEGRERALVEDIFGRGQLFAALRDHGVAHLLWEAGPKNP